MIPFNRPAVVGKELDYIRDAIERRRLSGDYEYTKRCHAWFKEQFNTRDVLLTTSGTSALDMAAVLTNVGPGDEVIMPSYTFTSTANAFVLRGATIVFVDIRPDTMNINEQLIEAAMTDRTKVIVPVHYAGVSCNMEVIMDIAQRHHVLVVEDAAQGVNAKYQGKWLGTIGHIGCYSFHETKNYTCGEGGAVVVSDESLIERAEIIREKGTDRSKFFRGQIDKYTWIDIGSSYLPSELNAAYLYAQLEQADVINQDRLHSWERYYNGLQPLAATQCISLPSIPDDCTHNAHMFYIKCKDLSERQALIAHLKAHDIMSVFHYIPLHSATAGKKFGRFHGEDIYTTKDSERLLRLPMYYQLGDDTVEKVVSAITAFYNQK